MGFNLEYIVCILDRPKSNVTKAIPIALLYEKKNFTEKNRNESKKKHSRVKIQTNNQTNRKISAVDKSK